jgi:thiol:disulfide interchange protein
MRPLLILMLVLAVSCKKDPSAAEPQPDPRPATTAASSDWMEVPAGTPLATALADFAAKAIDAGKKPYAYLHASWCGPCKAIEKTHATDPLMIDAFHGTAILTIDVDAADEKALKAQQLRGQVIPVFYKLDRTGKPTGDRIDGGAWGDNIPANMAPPLKAFFAK